MPIELIAEITQANNAPFALVDDSKLRGSFRVCNNLTDRNNIGTDFRKEGMQVYVISTDLLYPFQKLPYPLLLYTYSLLFHLY